MKRILFIIPPKVHLLDINGPAHIFYEAREMGAPIDLFFVSLDEKTEVNSSAGLTFSNVVPFSDFELGSEDYVFVPGLDFPLISDPGFLPGHKIFFKWLEEQSRKGATVCSVCTGAFLLAEAGILNGKKCTTHWRYLSRLRQQYPEADVQENRLFVEEDGIFSSAGVSSGIDLSLFLLEKEFGSRFAADIAKEAVIYFRRTESDPQLNVFLQYKNHMDDRIHQVQELIAHNLGKNLKLEELAEKVFMSPRNLTRLFNKTTGTTIGKYQDKLRMELATSLLKEGQKVDVVARECGLSSANQLRKLLKEQAGILPNELFSVK